MLSLQMHCYHSLHRYQESILFFNQRLDQEAQYYLCPPEIHRALIAFQERWHNYWTKKMSELLRINKLFHKEFREALLRPSNITFYAPIDARLFLQKGDHIVVFIGDVYHHGIYLGDRSVANVVSTAIPALQETTLAEFVGNRDRIGIVHHHFMREEENGDGVMEQVAVDTNSEAFRDETVSIVRVLLSHVATGGLLFRHYNLLDGNCECFAWAVITRNLHARSEQICHVWNLLMIDIERHRNQFTPAHAAAISFMSQQGWNNYNGCVIS